MIFGNQTGLLSLLGMEFKMPLKPFIDHFFSSLEPNSCTGDQNTILSRKRAKPFGLFFDTAFAFP